MNGHRRSAAHRLAVPIARAVVVVVLAVLATSPSLSAQPALPAPTGYVNDFAGVLSQGARTQLESIARIVQGRSGGELAIVTLPDLAGRPVEETALRIGREWGVGARAEIGEARRNAGTVILLVPRETSSDGRGYCRIETGMGAEGFITDAEAGAICRAATDRFRATDYSGGMLLVASRVAEAYAREFGFQLADGELPVRRAPAPQGGPGSLVGFMVLMLLLFWLSSRGKGAGCLPLLIASTVPPPGRYRGHHHGGFGGGFGGGGFGGGFGGFGGGGGFSGGGGGSSW
jgi:uncharacterized protein